MNAPVFADTFYWVALADRSDGSHEHALRLTDKYAESQIVTTDEVLGEFLTFFSEAPEPVRREAGQTVVEILANAAIRVIPQTRGSFEAGLKLYLARPDKGYSLIDCISMQTMRQEGLTEALTNDRHFDQEGFRALFRAS